MPWKELQRADQPHGGYEWTDPEPWDRWVTVATITTDGPAIASLTGTMIGNADLTPTTWNGLGTGGAFEPNQLLDSGHYYSIRPRVGQETSWKFETLPAKTRVTMNGQEFELNQSISTLNAGQIAKAIQVVKGFDRLSSDDGVAASTNVSGSLAVSSQQTPHELAHAFLHYAQIVAPSDPYVQITATTATSDWYQTWLMWTARAVAHGASSRELLQALRRRATVLRSSRPTRTTRVLQRVEDEVQRIRYSLRRHAPPLPAANDILAAGPGIT
jgi:hypothetical protein